MFLCFFYFNINTMSGTYSRNNFLFSKKQLCMLLVPNDEKNRFFSISFVRL